MPRVEPSIVVIGNFDGVHRGHQAVLAAVERVARERKLRPRMLTFDPHPAVTLGRQPPALLTSPERKRELVERHCAGAEVVVRAFTPAFAQQAPEAFARSVLVAQLHANAVMVGLNFRFGRGREGGFSDLVRLGAEHGFDAIAEPLVSDDQGAWSSTRVRGLVAAGDIEGATEILGRPHMLSGEVAHGQQRGRTIGFPTCNLPGVREAMPPLGVYAVLVDRTNADGAQPAALARGVANIGVRPTLVANAPGPLLEVHLFDVEDDLYGARLRVHLVARLRDERRFDGIDALREQIERDASAARARLADREPDPRTGSWA